MRPVREFLPLALLVGSVSAVAVAVVIHRAPRLPAPRGLGADPVLVGPVLLLSAAMLLLAARPWRAGAMRRLGQVGAGVLVGLAAVAGALLLTLAR
jgi:hypothetical protein